jgi:3''-phosphoadenosine 5''-phosphosulfate sulfotransferase (PAPS reductase)/FAD synthetase and related enzymes
MPTLRDALADKDNARHILSFSGGKDSTALAVYLLENYRELPLEVVFCDTGVELPETYEYIQRFEAIFGIEVVRLTALDLLGMREKGDRKPFDVFLHEYYGGFMPAPSARWCTRVLKIRPFERYIGTDKAYSYIGIRADENRQGYQTKTGKPLLLSEKPNILPVYPFKDEGLMLADIKRLLDESGLGLPPYYSWRSRSGCYFCFYQQIGEWQGLKQHHPDLFEKAKAYEKVEGGKPYTWVDGRSLGEIERINQRYEVPAREDMEGCAMCHL